jgi:SAM-dependent methyltransferase
MAHAEQQAFVQSVKDAFPSFFNGGRVLEVGSLNINGTVRIFFDADEYIGIDVGEGRDVDVVANGHEYKTRKKFDCAISCECFEHNPFWKETFANMVKLTKSGGLVLFTCATTGRPEHGTSRSDVGSSPLTVGNGWEYYKNLTEEDFAEAFDLDGMFKEKCFSVNTSSHDLYFWGIKQ